MRCVSVVGYQNKEIVDSNAGGYTWCLSTLPSVGVEKSALTLASWKVTPPEGGLWADQSVLLTTFDEAGQISGGYCYLDDIQCGMFGVDPGWYTQQSIIDWTPVSAADVVIPFGVGVQIASDCGATVTFAGEVVDGNSDFVVNDSNAGGYTWTGNVSPVDLKLKDFTITPPEGGLWADQSILLTTFDAAGQISGGYCYLDDIQCGMFGVDPGWYTQQSIIDWTPVSAADVNIISGEMFQIASDCGATLTIPSAL